MEKFSTERKELFAKIDTLNASVTSKDRELTILKNKFETQIEEVDKKKKALEEVRNEWNQEKAKLNEKIE